MQTQICRLATWVLCLATVWSHETLASTTREISSYSFSSDDTEFDWWQRSRLPSEWPGLTSSASRQRPTRSVGDEQLRDSVFSPELNPSSQVARVQQVVVTSDALEAAFLPYVEAETKRGIPTVLRTVEWIRDNYAGVDDPARIRRFLRDAHDFWGTRFTLLGGDVEHVPARYVPWNTSRIPTDVYYECLDGEWNEDGDGEFAEPVTQEDLLHLVSSVAISPGGTPWIATNVGVSKFLNGRFQSYGTDDGIPDGAIVDVEVAGDGSVWVGTTSGIAVLVGSNWTTITTEDGLPSNQVLSILPISATEYWAGTTAGLVHGTSEGVTVWTTSDGLPTNAITTVERDGDDIWVGSFGGVALLRGGVITKYTVINSDLLSNWVLSIAPDGNGNVWVGHDDNQIAGGGLSYFDGTSWTDYRVRLGENGVSFHSLHATETGVWGATSEGLCFRDRDLETDTFFAEPDGLPGSEFLDVATLPDGRLVLGGPPGLSIAQETLVTETTWMSYDRADGIPSAADEFDDVDLIPDLAVGRVPAHDSAQVATYLSKLETYRAGLHTDRVDRALFLGEVLFVGDDGKQFAERARAHFPASYQTSGIYEVDGTQTTASTVAGLNEGPGIVVHVGHGSYDVLGVGGGLDLLFNHHLDSVNSSGRQSLYIVYACNSGGFDQNSSMEHLLFNPNGGAIATVANTRTAVASVDADFNDVFFPQLFSSADSRPAMVLKEMRRALIEGDNTRYLIADWPRRMFLSRSFLGSPTVPIWTKTPTPLSVSHPATVPFRRAAFTVNVTNGAGLPLSGATVCLTKGDEDYAYGYTLADGSVEFSYQPESLGDVEIRVTHPEHLPHTSIASVSAATVPNLVSLNTEILATQTTPSGIEFTLRFELKNLGAPALSSWNVQLGTLDEEIVLLSGGGSLSALDTNEAAWSTPFVVRVSPLAIDGKTVEFSLRGIGASAFEAYAETNFAAPKLTFAGFDRVGLEYRPRVTNLGSTASGPVTITVTALTGQGFVHDGVATIANVAPGETVEFSDGLNVTGDPEAPFEIRMQDSSGRQIVREIDFLEPDEVRDLTHQPLPLGALLKWHPGNSPDIAGYRVFREVGSNWVDEFGIVLPSAQAHVPISSESATFRVVAVDHAGMESDARTLAAHSSPDLLPGWPQELSAIVGPSPVVAGDVDSDGTLEVLLGSMWEANALHIFHPNGDEWVDGDADPSTNGVAAETENRVHTAPLMIDIDGDGNQEIFCGSFDGKAYGWTTAGPGQPLAPLPGWPVSLGFNGSRSTFVPADVDGDGVFEIVVVAMARKVFAIEFDGSVVPGWPVETIGGGLGSTPAVHDFNNDGREDIVFGATDSLVYAVSGDGTNLPGWPIHVGAKVLSSPVLVDIDLDDDYEIFAFARDGRLWGFQHDDQDATPGPDLVPGWPAQLAESTQLPFSPAVGDLDQDGSPEIVWNGQGELAVLRADGTFYPGWPLLPEAFGSNSAVIADLDGDRSLDILVGTKDHLLTAYRSDGSVLPRWPWRFLEVPTSTPTVIDLDGDGDLDVVMGADDYRVNVLDLDAPVVAGATPWPGFHGGGTYRGVYFPQTIDVVDTPQIPGASSALSLLPAAPNPFRATTQVRFALPTEGRVTAIVYDVTGRRVRSLATRSLLPAGPHVLPWDGRNGQGRPVPAGVYFVRLETSGQQLSQKILRLR